MSTKTLTREEWLNRLVKKLHRTLFKGLVDTALPKYRVACSFPGGGAARTRIGECWSTTSSADGSTEMMVSPVLEDPMKVAGVIAHEMVHMYVGVKEGHGPVFKKLATAIGLEGKMTATTEGEGFKASVQAILDKMPAYPHAAINLADRKKKVTYLLKVACTDEGCGAVFRITRTWVDYAEDGMCCPVCQAQAEVEYK